MEVQIQKKDSLSNPRVGEIRTEGTAFVCSSHLESSGSSLNPYTGNQNVYAK